MTPGTYRVLDRALDRIFGPPRSSRRVGGFDSSPVSPIETPVSPDAGTVVITEAPLEQSTVTPAEAVQPTIVAPTVAEPTVAWTAPGLEPIVPRVTDSDSALEFIHSLRRIIMDGATDFDKLAERLLYEDARGDDMPEELRIMAVHLREAAEFLGGRHNTLELAIRCPQPSPTSGHQNSSTHSGGFNLKAMLNNALVRWAAVGGVVILGIKLLVG